MGENWKRVISVETTIGSITNIGTMAQVSGGTIGQVTGGTLGSVQNVGTMGSIQSLGTLGSLQAVATIGTLGSLQTVATVSDVTKITGGTLGSIQNIGTMGSLNAVASLGTITQLTGGTLGSVQAVASLGTITQLSGGTLGSLSAIATLGTLAQMSTGTISQITTGTLSSRDYQGATFTPNRLVISAEIGTTGTVAIMPTNTSRIEFTIHNTAGPTLYVKQSGTAGSTDFPITAGTYWSTPKYTGALVGYLSTTGTISTYEVT